MLNQVLLINLTQNKKKCKTKLIKKRHIVTIDFLNYYTHYIY